ncbi:MAG TPA: hypothetical protein VKQ36_10005, partial [Ktedonobacterales bacterium]|nr:hypothetical protein [Ktedonobacterales bacterium]
MEQDQDREYRESEESGEAQDQQTGARTGMGEAALTVSHVSKSYKTPKETLDVLHDLSFQVA